MSRESKRKEFVRLLEPLEQPLYAYCRHLLWNKQDTEDALQTALTNAYAAFAKFQDPANFKPWVFRFVSLTVCNFNRKHERWPTSLEAQEFSENAFGESDVETELLYEKLLEDPEKAVEQLDPDLASVLRQLSLGERRVFLLRSIGEFSYREIADMEQMPVGTVMTHLHRARQKLRLALCDFQRSDKQKEAKA